jgi:hypothetical protein
MAAELLELEPPQHVVRIYDGLVGLIEGLQAAHGFNLRNVKVTTTYEPGFTGENATVPPRFRYRLDAQEQLT